MVTYGFLWIGIAQSSGYICSHQPCVAIYTDAPKLTELGVFKNLNVIHIYVLIFVVFFSSLSSIQYIALPPSWWQPDFFSSHRENETPYLSTLSSPSPPLTSSPSLPVKPLTPFMFSFQRLLASLMMLPFCTA